MYQLAQQRIATRTPLRHMKRLGKIGIHLAMAASCMLFSACKDSYDYLVIDLVSTPAQPERVVVSSQQISLPEGQAVVFSAYARTRKNEVKDGDSLEFIVSPPSLGYVRELQGDEAFVLVAVTAGTGNLEVWVNGRQEDDISLVILKGE